MLYQKYLISFQKFQNQFKACICDVVRDTEKQKVSRVCLALLRNLLEASADNCKLLAAAMIGAKIQKTLEGQFWCIFNSLSLIYAFIFWAILRHNLGLRVLMC